jgi:hypothetical protein
MSISNFKKFHGVIPRSQNKKNGGKPEYEDKHKKGKARLRRNAKGRSSEKDRKNGEKEREMISQFKTPASATTLYCKG